MADVVSFEQLLKNRVAAGTQVYQEEADREDPSIVNLTRLNKELATESKVLAEIQDNREKNEIKLKEIELEKSKVELDSKRIAVEQSKVELESQRIAVEQSKIDLEDQRIDIERSRAEIENARNEIEYNKACKTTRLEWIRLIGSFVIGLLGVLLPLKLDKWKEEKRHERYLDSKGFEDNGGAYIGLTQKEEVRDALKDTTAPRKPFQFWK